MATKKEVYAALRDDIMKNGDGPFEKVQFGETTFIELVEVKSKKKKKADED